MRQKALFKKMRDYENVQVQLYLHALGFRQAYLVEGITTKTHSKLQVYIHEIAYNEEYVKEFILDRLKKFIAFFAIVMTDEEKKTVLLKGDNTREIYKYYQEEFLGVVDIDF